MSPTTPTDTPSPAGSLWWPGDHRAGDLMGERALLSAMVRVEQAWLDALVAQRIAPGDAAADLTDPGDGLDAAAIATTAESGGNPVMPMVAALRRGLPEPAATWLHRGLTSQDVLDTAVVLCARDAVDRLRDDLARQVDLLADLVRTHRSTPYVARTLTQPAVPSRFGLVAAGWLQGVLDAADAVTAPAWPAQLGGAAGTGAALVELAGDLDAARAVRRDTAAALGLDPVAPWHTTRGWVTRLGDAAVGLSDAWGHLARDVLTLGRPEVGELVDRSAGGSSTMPHKANPTLAVLVRRAALAAPPLAATLHAAAADQVDQRADGAWHVEWATLAVLLRRTVVAAGQVVDLLSGLEVRADAMADRLTDAGEDVLAEQRSMAGLAGRPPAPDYLGLTEDFVEEILSRAAGAADDLRRTGAEEER